MTETSWQLAAGQMVNLSNSQMVMNGVNDEITISLFDQSTNCRLLRLLRFLRFLRLQRFERFERLERQQEPTADFQTLGILDI